MRYAGERRTEGRRADKRSRRLPLSQNIPLNVPVTAAAGDSEGVRDEEEEKKGIQASPTQKPVSLRCPPSLRPCLKHNTKKILFRRQRKMAKSLCLWASCLLRFALLRSARLGLCWSQWLGSVCSPLRLLARAACVVRCWTLCSSFSPAPFLEICVSRSAVA